MTFNSVLPIQLGHLVAVESKDPLLGLLDGAFPVLVAWTRSPVLAGSRALLFPLGGIESRNGLGPEGSITLRIGRAREENDIVIEVLSISRRHGALVKRDGHWSIVDLGSLNGTTLHGERLVRGRPADLDENEKRLSIGQGIELMLLDKARFPREIAELRLAAEREALTTTQSGKRVPPSITMADEFLAARLLDGIRLAPFTPSSYDLVLDDGAVHVVESWPDLVLILGHIANRVARIEAGRPDGGPPFVLDAHLAMAGETSTFLGPTLDGPTLDGPEE
jgi:hypothetical protein